ncbi:hypothetical protein KCP91_06280 [Microvirga sp. SRT01]|jgi:hypothetical protein|uniref:Uncharacterized protein n=1 Tax=Sphingomonas longa TaxID=2778730 RepID=A0ABS2D4X5_9SPHN|nr:MULTISPECIES: hypothetical protein [Alphaproteobacteria]MBM6575972.1 hypothetical protein [Sphingomonas sp. BT552]MBR7709018.1 hypothetical protein [Microvirga sp. SRT01]
MNFVISEAQAMSRLATFSQQLNRVSDRVLTGRKAGVGFSHQDLKSSLEVVSHVIQECEIIIADHASGRMRASDRFLLAVCEALTAAHMTVAHVGYSKVTA